MENRHLPNIFVLWYQHFLIMCVCGGGGGGGITHSSRTTNIEVKVY